MFTVGGVSDAELRTHLWEATPSPIYRSKAIRIRIGVGDASHSLA